LREKIIESGVDTLRRRGFAGAGVREITHEAAVPQGCFTNHFRSKEAFGSIALERYQGRVDEIMQRTLHDATLTPLRRLERYFDEVTAQFAAEQWRFGCLIGNFSAEVAADSDLIGEQLAQIHAAHAAAFAAPLRAGQSDGTIRDDIAADDLADLILAAWQGSIARMKVERSPRALRQFKLTMFQMIARATG
jgi:TetR/AcrR family transcriptional repressor of nem operon